MELCYVPNLKCFSSGTFNIDLPSCEEMIVEKCLNMTTFCYGSVTTARLIHIYKGSYEYVDIMGDLNMTIYHANEGLKIRHCLSLKSVLSPSMARSFSQLQELSVHECEMIEEITSNEEKELSEEPNKVKITFPGLQWLTLYRRLRCFYSSTYHFELPSCHDITITECPKMEACHGTRGTSELPFLSMKKNDFRDEERS
ncbi:hypothetical protein JHK85_053161 [Glycine max]|nr:hypothetical protein JHK85_053161 [Glycine max]